MGLAEQKGFEATAEDWQWLYEEAVRQSLVGVCWQGVCLLPKDNKPPVEIGIQWAGETETISGLNELQYKEAVRLTKLFGDAGHQTAILKGQANARLYPDKFSRQPGDIDLWVEGGRNSVINLLISMGLLDEIPTIENVGKRGRPTKSYHHVHLPPNEKRVSIEVHYRPSSGNFNPFTNKRLQRWLEQEILHTTTVPEGFNVPSVCFALVMQLSHIQRHFLRIGIGLRQICDYYWLLRNSSEEERQVVADCLKGFGLRETAGALMWVLNEVLQLDRKLMLCEPDSYRGEWMLRKIMDGGNFGYYAQAAQGMWRRVFAGKLRQLRLMRFYFGEVFWGEVNYCKVVIQTLPERIRRRSFSLAETNKRDAMK